MAAKKKSSRKKATSKTKKSAAKKPVKKVTKKVARKKTLSTTLKETFYCKKSFFVYMKRTLSQSLRCLLIGLFPGANMVEIQFF